MTCSQSNSEARSTVTYIKSKSPAPQPYNLRSLPPPELPPRATSPMPPVSSSWHGQRQIQGQEQGQGHSPPRQGDQTTTINSIGRCHSAVMPANVGKYYFPFRHQFLFFLLRRLVQGVRKGNKTQFLKLLKILLLVV